MTRSSEGLDTRRRKALYHSWHRGTREMDLVLGRFADACIASMSEDDLSDYELLMEAQDRDLFAWMTDTEETPGNYDTPVFRQVKAFHAGGDEVRS